MQTLTRQTKKGEIVYTLSEASKAGITSHRFATRDGKPYLHIMPNEDGNCTVLKFIPGLGYMPVGELVEKFDTLKIDKVVAF